MTASSGKHTYFFFFTSIQICCILFSFLQLH